jgi:acyl dehydratase
MGGLFRLLGEFESGRQFAPYSIQISQSEADAYASAVGDTSPIATSGKAVPPMALIAAGLSKMIESLGLGGGTVHASQEVEFARSVAPGEVIEARTILKANSVRRGSRFATVETEFYDAGNNRVARSVSMVTVPK